MVFSPLLHFSKGTTKLHKCNFKSTLWTCSMCFDEQVSVVVFSAGTQMRMHKIIWVMQDTAMHRQM